MKRLYGSSPLHLVAHLAALALCGYALIQILGMRSGVTVLIWLGAAVLLHDALLWPVETLLDRGAQAGLGRAVNFIRVPAGISLLLLLIFFPVISQKGEKAYSRVSGETFQGDAGRWLAVTAGLFALSGLAYVARSAAGRRRPAP